MQAKDTEVLPHVLQRVGVRGEGWWRHRVPGLGDVDFGKFLSALQDHGYDGVVSIEHEDPIWHGSEERVIRGLELGRDHLRRFF